MQPRFGHSLDSVRVHTDERAARTARVLGARAFTVGDHISFGAGQYAPRSPERRRLVAHELTHVVQQRSHSAPVLRRDAISDVRDKLSYSSDDWAITDSEAMEALALLVSLDPAKLPAELGRLGQKYITRLLDNLPDAAKTGADYQRVLRDIKVSGALAYAVDELTTGFFDWAVTDAEVGRVFNLFQNFDAAGKERFFVKLHDKKKLGTLFDNSNSGHHALYILPWVKTIARGTLTADQKAIFRTLVENSPAGPLETLTEAATRRFDVDVSKSTSSTKAVEWEPRKLHAVYMALDPLPDAHIKNNRELLRFGQFERKPTTEGYTTAGTYNSNNRELSLNTKAGDIKATAIHETGDAVDKVMGYSTGAEPAKSARGGWTQYKRNWLRCAADMTGDSLGGIVTELTANQQSDVQNKMVRAMMAKSTKGLKAKIRGLGWWSGLAKNKKKAVLADKALGAITVGLDKPWFKANDGGVYLDKHVYQASYGTKWVRYEHAARKRLLTKYQFRDPGEWFAEAYEFYYTPDKRPTLTKTDPDTKKYFDDTVSKIAGTR